MRRRRASLGLAWALSALSLFASCAPSSGKQTITTGDAQLFAGFVQPYLELRCASLDCHGDRGRPLRLYSELGLRRDGAQRSAPISELREPTALTAQELEDNRLALAAIATAGSGPSAHLALQKPLALSAGGIAHEGGVHWASRSDAGYLCLRGYLLGDLEQDTAVVCARATAEATTALSP